MSTTKPIYTVNHYADRSETLNENGKLNSLNDQPAITYKNGTKMWYANGVLHRAGDKPAVVGANGLTQFWVDGKQITSEVVKAELDKLRDDRRNLINETNKLDAETSKLLDAFLIKRSASVSEIRRLEVAARALAKKHSVNLSFDTSIYVDDEPSFLHSIAESYGWITSNCY